MFPFLDDRQEEIFVKFAWVTEDEQANGWNFESQPIRLGTIL